MICLIVSPDVWTRSGDIAAVEYGNETPVKAVMQVTYTDDFIVLSQLITRQRLLLLCVAKIILELSVALLADHQRLD